MEDTSKKIRTVFAANLEYQLRLHGKSAVDLVNDLDFPASTVSSWTNGQKFPRIDKVQKIADYLGILKSDLTEEKSHEKSLDEQLSGIDFALSGELHDLTDEEKQDILDYVRFKKEQKKGK